MATFSERLKKLRKENDITLNQLASDLNTTKSTLSRYENNKREPKMHLLEKLADYFEVSLDYLLGRSEEPLPADKIKEAISEESESIKIWDKLKDREELQIMFKRTENLNEDTIKHIIEIIKTFENREI